jgi:hypothetical protein
MGTQALVRADSSGGTAEQGLVPARSLCSEVTLTTHLDIPAAASVLRNSGAPASMRGNARAARMAQTTNATPAANRAAEKPKIFGSPNDRLSQTSECDGNNARHGHMRNVPV